jgi:cytochrome c oxidase subunit 3
MTQSATKAPMPWFDQGSSRERGKLQALRPETTHAEVAHPFETPEHQFSAGKLGIWLFLASETLFFGGLFCAYQVCRSARPDIFQYGHYFLDTSFGAFNTCVLLVSSFTAACAVRAAQRKQRRLLVANIAATILCGVLFLTVKGFEYADKFEHGLLPGVSFNPSAQVWETESFRRAHPAASEFARTLRARAAVPVTNSVERDAATQIPTRDQVEPLVAAGIVGPNSEYGTFPSLPRNAHQFFGLYFLMTGVHALHVLLGIGVWCWLLVRAAAGSFTTTYFGPIDYAALYWHFVDLIWIYLFPLLYLIH